MNRKKKMLAWLIVASLMVANSGCALLATALSAGAAYGIYMATKKK